MTTQVAVVTGATEGIGKQTATELARKGFLVVVHGRSAARASEAAEAIAKAAKGSGAVDTAVADLASLKQVRAMAEALVRKHPRIDVLVNNAGVFSKERKLTEDGFEQTVAVNHFAHFVLTHLVLPALGAAEQGRIVNVASNVHSGGEVDLDDLNLEKDWSGYGSYSTSKLMNVLFSNELARRLPKYADFARVTSSSLHPGVISTKLLHAGWGAGGASLEHGARTSVKVATDPSLAKTSGAYFSDEREVACSPRGRDPKLARDFYDRSCALTGIAPL